MNPASLINQDSGNVERYTPPYIAEVARNVLGQIDLDPASSVVANETIQATTIFTLDTDREYPTLVRPWSIWYQHRKVFAPSRVFMNHPYSRTGNLRWINKLISEYQAGNVREAVCLVFASTSERWFQPLYQFPICFIKGRVHHNDATGKPMKSSTKGSCLVYLGSSSSQFAVNAAVLGNVVVNYRKLLP